MAKYGPHICTSCMHDDKADYKGSFLISLLLLLCFLIPGIIYILWCWSAGKVVCPKCKHATMIPITTPRGQELIIQKYGASITEHVNKVKKYKRKTIHIFLILAIAASLYQLFTIVTSPSPDQEEQKYSRDMINIINENRAVKEARIKENLEKTAKKTEPTKILPPSFDYKIRQSKGWSQLKLQNMDERIVVTSKVSQKDLENIMTYRLQQHTLDGYEKVYIYVYASENHKGSSWISMLELNPYTSANYKMSFNDDLSQTLQK